MEPKTVIQAAVGLAAVLTIAIIGLGLILR